MKNMTPEILAHVLGVSCQGSSGRQTEITSVVTDSREVQKGSLFIAIKGERTDGNCYIHSCYEKGALCCISQVSAQENGVTPEEGCYIQVPDVYAAIQHIAKYYREQCDIKVVGITGSVGKTSTKEMIASVLSTKYNTVKTQGNFNNELGVPLTLFQIRSEHEIAVVEMGISDFGEMTRLANMVMPDVMVITNIGCCHLEHLGDRDGVLKAKTESLLFVKKDGTIIVNGEDDKLQMLPQIYPERTPVYYGISGENTWSAGSMENLGLEGSLVTITGQDSAFEVQVPLPGKHMVSNALAAAAVGHVFGLDDAQIAEGIAALKETEGRGHVIRTRHFTVLDDCYNANPNSMRAGLDILADVEGRRVAVMGDMGELGSGSSEYHYEIGEYAATRGMELIVAIGSLSEHMARGAADAGAKQVLHYDTIEDALAELPGYLEDGDAVFVKASHSMAFTKVVEWLQTVEK